MESVLSILHWVGPGSQWSSTTLHEQMESCLSWLCSALSWYKWSSTMHEQMESCLSWLFCTESDMVLLMVLKHLLSVCLPVSACLSLSLSPPLSLSLSPPSPPLSLSLSPQRSQAPYEIPLYFLSTFIRFGRFNVYRQNHASHEQINAQM